MVKKNFCTILLLMVPWQMAARVLSAPRQPRLSLAEPELRSYYDTDIDGQPGTYSFGYDYTDWSTAGNTHYRHERRFPNGTVVGDYGYSDPNGRQHMYRYIADERGYRIMRDHPRRHAAPVIINPSANSQNGNEITWTRKKTNIMGLQKNKMQYPGKYVIY